MVSLVYEYTLTEVSDLTVNNAFYATLQPVIDQCPGERLIKSWEVLMHRLELIGMAMRRVLVPMGLEL